MKTINPLNRTPDADETTVMACRCVCDTGSAGMKTVGARTSPYCGCQCISGNTENQNGNHHWARG